MNLKRWFAWLCLALMLVAEIFLFHANRDKDAALTSLRAAQHELRQAQTELDELKNSNAGSQAGENSRLRKQNEIITAKLAAVQTSLTQAQAENQQLAQQLGTARTALNLQQDHLQQLQTENAAARTQQSQQAALIEINQRNTCISHLRQIDAAKNQWALENSKPTSAIPTVQDVAVYIKLDANGNIPGCPAGGTYTIGAVGDAPTCSIPGHDLSQ